MKEFAAIRSDENMADSTREAAIEALGKRFDSLNEATMTENAGNPLGLYLFISKAYDLNLAQMDSGHHRQSHLWQQPPCAEATQGVS